MNNLRDGDKTGRVIAVEPIYDDEYFKTQVHQKHWFKANNLKWRERETAIINLLDPSFNDLVLELGCAAGDTTPILSRRVKKVIGIDNSIIALKYAAKKKIKGAVFVASDINGLLAFKDQVFDKVVALDLIEHITDKELESMLHEAKRVLKRQGTLSIYTPNRNHYVEKMKEHGLINACPTHIAVRYTQEIIKCLGNVDFQIKSIFYTASPYPFFRWLDIFFRKISVIEKYLQFRICICAEKK